MGRYELMFNRLEIRDDMEMPISVASGSYLRVVLTLPEGTPGTSSICADPLVPPAGFPVRDNDGRIADERNFIFAGGAGWFWSEDVPGGAINGDWGIRLSVFNNTGMPGDDAGPGGADGGAGAGDGGTGEADGGGTGGMDAGTTDPMDDGCGCRAVGSTPAAPSALFGGLVALLRGRRRRR